MLKIAPQPLQEERLAECKQCEFFLKRTMRCGKCGCFMKAKVLFEEAKCPVGKW